LPLAGTGYIYTLTKFFLKNKPNPIKTL
jgi:hypothetical protein